MLSSSMQYLAYISRDKKIKTLEVERLFEIVKLQGKEISWEEFDRLQKSQRERNRQWWNDYKKIFAKT